MGQDDLGNADLKFRSVYHSWASGLVTAVLMMHPDVFRARPAVDENDNVLPQVLVTVAGREFRVLIEELQ